MRHPRRTMAARLGDVGGRVDVSGEFVLARDVALIDGPLVGGGSVGRQGDSCGVAFLHDVDIVRLIARFRSPTTICDAIWEAAAEMRRHPEDILEHSYPVVRDLISAGYIVRSGSALARHRPGMSVTRALG